MPMYQMIALSQPGYTSIYQSVTVETLVLFNPEDYVKTWSGKGRHAASDTNSKARNPQADDNLKHIWHPQHTPSCLTSRD